jgi:HK97 gp10 family phage protein
MAGEFAITVTGVEEVKQFLAEAPKTLVATGFLRALQAGGEVIRAAVEARTPVGGEKLWNEETFSEIATTGGALIQGLTMDVNLDSNFQGGIARIGFTREQAHVANWVEFGHRMVGHKPKKKLLGQVEPHPFMRPALAESANAAIEAFGESMLETIRSEYGE